MSGPGRSGGGLLFFFFTLVTGPRGSLSLTLSETRVYAPQTRALLGTTPHFCEVVRGVRDERKTATRIPVPVGRQSDRRKQGGHLSTSGFCRAGCWPAMVPAKVVVQILPSPLPHLSPKTKSRMWLACFPGAGGRFHIKRLKSLIETGSDRILDLVHLGLEPLD